MLLLLVAIVDLICRSDIADNDRGFADLDDHVSLYPVLYFVYFINLWEPSEAAIL